MASNDLIPLRLAPRCPECGGVLLFASGVEICANRRCSRYGKAA